jgi:serine phosphatase RsbU (regulator of sigma subunit)
MRILVGWDDRQQAELIRLYLNVDDNAVVVSTDHHQLLSLAESQRHWDGILLTTGSPDYDTAFQVFSRLRELLPDCPIVAACRTDDVYRIARYLTHGLRGYVIRDERGDFMFLLHAVLEGAARQVESERERLVAEKLRREIDSVRRLQESIIPQEIESPAGYRIVARYEASQIRVIGGHPVTLAGGDYYDAFTLPDDSVVLLVGDASGHGMKACMSIMTMHTLIRMIRANRFRDTARFVQYVNRQLCEQRVVNDEGGFITLLYGILNPRTHMLQWTSAGHPPPLLQRLADDVIEPLGDESTGGLPLGILPEAEYSVMRTKLPPGSRLLLYTDGLAEAFTEGKHGHREFGRTGLEQALRDSRGLPLQASLQRLFDTSHAFTDGQGRHDDSSVLLLERLAESVEPVLAAATASETKRRTSRSRTAS